MPTRCPVFSIQASGANAQKAVWGLMNWHPASLTPPSIWRSKREKALKHACSATPLAE